MTKLIWGVGVNDLGYRVQINEELPKNGGKRVQKSVFRCKYYTVWENMLKRCYSKKFLESNQTYSGTSVCSEWLYATAFKKWMEQQDWHDKCLDKDIIALEVEQKTNLLEVQAPKNDFFDNYAYCGGSLGFREVAKLLKAKEHEFRSFLCAKRYMYQLSGMSNDDVTKRFKPVWNLPLIVDQNIDQQGMEKLQELYNALGEVLDHPHRYPDPVATVERLEYALQKTWKFEEDSKMHRYWNQVRGCTCPQDDNFLALGTGVRYYNSSCKWHGVSQ